jgi:malate dehydrogenase
MVNAVVGDTGEVLPACVWANGQYGISDVFVGLPARLGSGGVKEIVELDLGQDVLASLREAAEGIRSRCRDLAELD